MRRLVPWVLIFACALLFTKFVDLGGNFFGLPDSAVQVLFAANLTLFLWLLARFAGRPMAGFLDARREEIADKLAQAEKRLEEAQQLRDEVRQRLDRMEHEVAELGERAAREGRAEAEQIAEQSERDEQRFLKRVDDEIGRRQTEARHLLARETAELTAQLTRELLERELTDADRRRILDRSLAAMRTATEE